MKHLSKNCKFPTLFLVLLGATAAVGQNYKPAIEYQSLMNMRYYENNGGFLVEDLLRFPAREMLATRSL